MFFTLFNGIDIFDGCFKLGWDGSIHDGLEQLHPWVDVVVLSHEGAQIQLVGGVVNLANKKHDLLGYLALHVQCLVH